MPNLITNAWLPVVRLSGARTVVRPQDLTSQFQTDPIIALGFARPDFNAAVTEFLIGLVSLAYGQGPDQPALKDLWRDVPDDAALDAALAPFAGAFELLGDGPCAFQDLEPLEGGEVLPLERLLIDAAAGNTVKLNQDLFTSRYRDLDGGDWDQVAAALITLQTFAPSGGQGHRTSMRGGGPLTTLALPHREIANTCVTTIWDLLIANRRYGCTAVTDKAEVFAWLKPTLTSEGNAIVNSDMLHPLHAFFATPRRIRLVEKSGRIVGYRTRPRGMNYENWTHPLSPYYRDKDQSLLPVHPRPGEPTYRDWPRYCGTDGQSAWALGQLDDPPWGSSRRVHAFGYDMDNMKARAWVELRMPLIDEDVADLVRMCIDGAKVVADALKRCAQDFHYGRLVYEDDKATINKDPNLSRDACAQLPTLLERRTESALRRIIDRLQAPASPSTSDNEIKLDWMLTLRREALALFDQDTDLANCDGDAAIKLAFVRRRLTGQLGPGGKAAKALGIVEFWKYQQKERSESEVAA